MRSAFAPLSLMFRSAPLALALAMAGLSGSALAAPKADIQALAQKHQQPLLDRSEEHTSELQSPCNLVCRLLLEKKKKNNITIIYVDPTPFLPSLKFPIM